jgi:hypothetical protein
MKERAVVGAVVALLVMGVIVATFSTDLIYIAAAVFFFALCIAYAEWCERL